MSAPPPTRSQKGKIVCAALAVAVLIGLAFFLVLFFTPQFHPSGRAPLRDLKTFYLCILFYAQDHGGAYPPDLITVVNEQIPAGPSRESFLKRYFSSDGRPIPALHYHKPPPTANVQTAPLPPDTVLLTYDDEKAHIYVTADGAGKVEKKTR